MTIDEDPVVAGSFINKYIIRPSNKHDKKQTPAYLKKIPLHGLDAMSLPTGFSVLWYFSAPSNTTSVHETVERLKSSLAQVLELYPPMTGTVHSDDNENYYISLDKSSNSGVPFYFERRNTPYLNSGSDDEEEGLSARNEKEHRFLTSESIALEVKVTQFLCGTIVIATSCHHQIHDIQGLIDFVQLWASITRGEPIDYSRIPGNWDRTPSRFFPTQIGKPSVPDAFLLHPKPVPIEKSIEFANVPGKATIWTMTENSINQLKADILSTAAFKNINNDEGSLSSLSPPWISKGDALTALVCGALTRARENNPNVERPWGRSNRESKARNISMTCNCRTHAPEGKIQSGDYFGNFIAQTNVAVQCNDLLIPTVDATGRSALTIRTALKNSLAPQNIANYLAFFDPNVIVKPKARLQLKWDVIVTNWCQYDLSGSGFDFGWGKPLKGVPHKGSEPPPGFCLIMNGAKSGDVIIYLTVELSCVKELEDDILLNKYATLVQ